MRVLSYASLYIYKRRSKNVEMVWFSWMVNSLLWRNYNPSDKNNYISIIPDPSASQYLFSIFKSITIWQYCDSDFVTPIFLPLQC